MELAIIDGHRSGGGDQLPVAGMEGYQEEAEGTKRERGGSRDRAKTILRRVGESEGM